MSESPCVRNCCLDQQDCCLGCGRLVQEIMEWHTADVWRREQILRQAARRMTQREATATVMRPAASLFE
ncbi:DUF1289 domain-containing protein [Rheinheimera sp. NSM]|uniref:DUF1289 domain-containing protein n=1 Tax=Rheinheimera sp. NSM TaxID=3457884 RepID=UPI004035B134